MPRKPKNVDWIAIEGAYRAGKNSIRAIGREYGTSDTSIRKHAKKHGWVRDPAGTKREIVWAEIAGVGSQAGSQNALQTIGDEAALDVEDMNAGLHVARLCIRRLAEMVSEADKVGDIKTAADANRVAIDTIRRIRGLDADDAAPETRIEVRYVSSK